MVKVSIIGRTINTIVLMLLATLTFAIEISINSVLIDPTSNCTSNLFVNFDLDVSNSTDDGIGAWPGADLVHILIRDGECNPVFWTDYGFTDGHFTITLKDYFIGIIQKPSSRPFFVSFHDSNVEMNVIDINETLVIPPISTVMVNPSTHPVCGTLPLQSNPSCSYASAIPSLSQWGIVILSIILMIVGVNFILDKQKSFQV